MIDYEKYGAELARLVILKELAKQHDHGLNENLIMIVLDAAGYLRSREWMRTQLNKLKELDAISIVKANDVLVAKLTRTGLDHVERRSVIAGVARLSPEA